VDVGSDEAVRDKLLRTFPFCVSFSARAALYYKARDDLRRSMQDGVPSTRVVIHRARVFEVGGERVS
jgi:hypothetical protein